MPIGNVKWFDTKKGFGFIIGDGGLDVFVHYTNILGDGFRALKENELVDYELVQGPKGLQARNVRRLPTPPAPPDGHPAPISPIAPAGLIAPPAGPMPPPDYQPGAMDQPGAADPPGAD